MFTDRDAAFTSGSELPMRWQQGTNLLEKPDWWQLEQMILRGYTVEQKWKSVSLRDFKERGKQLRIFLDSERALVSSNLHHNCKRRDEGLKSQVTSPLN